MIIDSSRDALHESSWSGKDMHLWGWKQEEGHPTLQISRWHQDLAAYSKPWDKYESRIVYY